MVLCSMRHKVVGDRNVLGPRDRIWSCVKVCWEWKRGFRTLFLYTALTSSSSKNSLLDKGSNPITAQGRLSGYQRRRASSLRKSAFQILVVIYLLTLAYYNICSIEDKLELENCVVLNYWSKKESRTSGHRTV